MKLNYLQTSVLVLLTGLLFGSLSSCTNGDVVSEFKTYKITEEFKKYAAFDSLSYWVYRKTTSTTSNIDTVKVTNVSLDRRFHTDVNNPGYFYDAIELSLSSTFLGLTKSEIAAGSQYESSNMDELLRFHYFSGKYYTVLLPHIPIDSTVHLGNPEGDYSNVSFHEEQWVNGIAYQEVFESRVITDSTEMHFYIAKNFGLIKYTSAKITGTGLKINDEWVLETSSLIPIP